MIPISQPITSFKFEIGSYFGGHERIEYKKGKVTNIYSDYPFHYEHQPPNVIERVIDSKELEPLSAMLPVITGWEKYSHNSDIEDGSSWSIRIHCGRQQIIREGYCTETPEYDQMCSILEKLSGRKMFGDNEYEEEIKQK